MEVSVNEEDILELFEAVYAELEKELKESDYEEQKQNIKRREEEEKRSKMHLRKSSYHWQHKGRSKSGQSGTLTVKFKFKTKGEAAAKRCFVRGWKALENEVESLPSRENSHSDPAD